MAFESEHREPDEDIESFQSYGTLSGRAQGGQLASIGAIFCLRPDGCLMVERLLPGGAAAQSGSIMIGLATFPRSWTLQTN